MKELQFKYSSNDNLASQGSAEIKKGDCLRQNRYLVIDIVGSGTFGKVIKCLDRKYNTLVAIKIIRAIKEYTRNASSEIDVLEKIHKYDPYNLFHCVRIRSNFNLIHKGQEHVCISFEQLGPSLYQFMRNNRYRGFRITDIEKIAFQLLVALFFLKHIRLVHTDIKVENILFVSSNYYIGALDDSDDFMVPKSKEVRIIDFGSATFEHEKHERIITTRQYRSPEVILGLDWSYPSDMWSLGCVLAELCTGSILFSTNSDLEHLVMMEKILDKNIDPEMIANAIKKDAYRDRLFEAQLEAKAKQMAEIETQAKKKTKTTETKWAQDINDLQNDIKRQLKKYSRRKDSIKHIVTNKGTLNVGKLKEENKEQIFIKASNKLDELICNADLVHLISNMLEYNPTKRITPENALNHAFFKHLPFDFRNKYAFALQTLSSTVSISTSVAGSAVPGSVVPGSVMPGSVMPGSVIPGSTLVNTLLPISGVGSGSCSGPTSGFGTSASCVTWIPRPCLSSLSVPPAITISKNGLDHHNRPKG